MKEPKDILIIGAGISGLIAAQELEKQGYAPVIVEKGDEVGGRLLTRKEGDWPLDLGFQVLLTAYPAVREYLDLDALDLVEFKPGAAVFANGEMGVLGDPIRHPPFFYPTVTNRNLTLKDKWLTFRLQRELRSMSLEEIFSMPGQSTLSYLQAYGFSESCIDYFFRPFFSGIFLEPRLESSSRMFAFVYKMFSEGKAAVPRLGINQVALQLRSRLRSTRFRFGTSVRAVESGSVHISDGSELKSEAILIACRDKGLIREERPVQVGRDKWRCCQVVYAWIEQPLSHSGILGISGSPGTLINNWSEVPPPRILSNAGGKRLLSLTLVEPPDLNREDLYRRVKDEIGEIAGIELQGLVDTFRIDQALPILSELTLDFDPHDSRLPGVYHSGDHCMFPSLQAAMESGKRAANAILADMVSSA